MGKAKLDYDVLSDFELIEIFKSEYERIKPSGCVDFYNNTDIAPSLYIITKRLKMKWNDMLIFIGVDEDKILFKRIDKEDCIRILHEIYKTEGKTPTAQDLINNGHCAQTFKKNFGSFSNALECAGLTPNKSPTKVTEDKRELLEQYIKLSKMLGRPANHKDIVESNFMHNPSVYTIRFGGIGGLRKAAGLEQLLYD